MTMVSEDMLAQWRDAIGRRQRSVETLELESLRRYALAIGGNGDVEQRQPALPHWAFFLPRPTDGDLGADPVFLSHHQRSATVGVSVKADMAS